MPRSIRELKVSRRRLAAAAAAALLVSFAWPAGAQPATEEIRFEIQPPDAGAKINPATLVLRGEILTSGAQYHPPLSGGRKDSLLDFLSRLSRASREGKAADHLVLWNPAEQEAVRPVVTGFFDRNQALARTVERSNLRARFLYGPYVLAVVRHVLKDGAPIVSVYPLVRDGESYFLTDRLAADPLFIYLTAMFRKRFEGQP